MDEFIYQISLLLSFILSFFFFIIIFLIIFEITFRVNKNETEKHLKFYGLFMGLNNYDIFLFSLKTISYVLLLWSILSNTILPIHFILFILLQISFDLCSFRYINFFPNLINNLFICFLLYSKQIFCDYLFDVTFLYSVVILIILLSLFMWKNRKFFWPAAKRCWSLLCNETKLMLLHRCQDAQIALYSLRVVVKNVILDHLN